MWDTETARNRHLCAADLPELGHADTLLVRGDATAALAAYREVLTAEPNPAAWIGLALAADRLLAMAWWPAFADRLPLLFEVHRCPAGQGIHADPMELWPGSHDIGAQTPSDCPGGRFSTLTEWLAGLVGSLRARVPATVNVAVQTNGTPGAVRCWPRSATWGSAWTVMPRRPRGTVATRTAV